MMNNYLKFMIIFMVVALSTHRSATAQQRGDLLSSVLIEELSTEGIDELLTTAIDGIPPFFIGLLVPTTYDVEAYKLTYNTINEKGQNVPATGAIFIPKGYNCPAALAPYLHGTLTADNTLPSTLNGQEAAIGWALATDGYVTVLPDYLGLGDSPGVHPYLHAETQASASIDMMRAARQFCAQNNIALNGQVFLSGFSQGGYAALATQREIEANYASEFNLEMVVGGAGPYDLSGIQRAFVLDNPTYTNPSLFPFILFGYQEVYGNLYSNLQEAYAPPFDRTLPELFDGSNDVEQIDSQLPVNWQDIFQPAYFRDIERNLFFNPVNRALRDNNLLDWAPKAETKLCYCTGDELVAYQNSLIAWLNYTIRGAGGSVQGIPLGGSTHRACAPIVLIVAKLMFEGKRNESCATNARKGKAYRVEGPQSAAVMKMADPANWPTLTQALHDSGLDGLATQLPGYEAADVLTLSPNPASLTTVAQLGKAAQNAKSLSIMDLAGREVYHTALSATQPEVSLDIASLKPGIYMVVLDNNKQMSTRLVVK